MIRALMFCLYNCHCNIHEFLSLTTYRNFEYTKSDSHESRSVMKGDQDRSKCRMKSNLTVQTVVTLQNIWLVFSPTFWRGPNHNWKDQIRRGLCRSNCNEKNRSESNMRVTVILPSKTCSWIHIICWSWNNLALSLPLNLTPPLTYPKN